MSKNILFVYSDIVQKKTFEDCEVILRCALKRFRKSASFTYMQFDFSPLGYALSEQRLLSDIKNFDAVIWDCAPSHLENELNFAVKSLGSFAAVHTAGGRFIITPLSERKVVSDKNSVSESYILQHENIHKAALLAAGIAKRRKSALTLCCDFENSFFARTLLREYENALGEAGRLEVKELSYNEFLWGCSLAVPDFSVLLTSEREAQIAHLNLCALKKCPTGYTVWHADKIRLYRREVLPYEQMNNYPLASLLFACAQAISSELGYENIGARLKKCVALALEKCATLSTDEFKDELVSLINERIRHRALRPDKKGELL